MKGSRFRAACLALFLLFLNLAVCAETGRAAQSASTDLSKLGLTDAEIQFVKDHPVIRLGVDPEFIPYEFFDSDGEYKGIAADYIDLITKETGLTFEVARGLTWSEAYENAVERKLDALPCVSKTAQRAQYFLFSDPYISFERVMFVNKDNTDIKTFDDLYGKTVAVQRDSSHHSFLSDYSQIKLSLYTNVEDALRAVSTGKESVFVGNLATSSYLIKSNGITNLKYIPIDAEESPSLYFAVRSDWPELVGILNKALGAIDEESKIAISNKWIGVEGSADYTWIIRIIVVAGAVVAIVLIVSFFWIIRLRKEIARRRKIQADLENAKREADEANKFKSNFLARMSHEIRTPLNGIIGMAYLLKKTSVTLTQKMYVDRITQSSTNMLGIINDILDFSKIEAGKVELEIASFSLDQVIQDVVNIVSYKIEEQEIGFVLSKDPLIPNWFSGDAKRIEQVLINILNNAAKFTSKGEVSLDVRLVAKENGQYHLAFFIKDTGIGMSEEQVKKLFVPFAQGDVSINRRFGGTGLGLSIVKNLVDLMGGQIQVFSTVGEGSTFIIHLSLPVDREKEDEYKKNVSADHFKDVRTLVLEKTGSNMNLIQNYLESFGMSCELTTSQSSALGMLEAANGKYAKPFDLMIVDYDTPAEGGFKFVEALNDNPRIVKKPRVLMLLPMMRDDLFDQLDERGVDIGVGKPIVPSILLNAILDIFNLKAVAASRASDAAGRDVSPFEEPHCVLVAEDNKTNQLIAKSLLEQVGLEVLLAENGKVAVERYGQNREKIDLILMDLHMPVMNGYEAALEIRKSSPGVPIVAMTADVITGVQEKCEQHGIQHYLSKPFDPDRFIQAVRDILREGSFRREAGANVLDAASGRKNLGVDQGVYLQILNEYQNENLETADRLARAIREKRYADAAGIVHKMKSSSASIGAKPLYELAVRLQKALETNAEGDIEALGGDFSILLARLLDEILEMLNPQA
jgi:signal transduction histidine kinase/DNA-binding response OmpR family regulator